MANQNQKWYVVFVGREPGIYNDWFDCAAQVLEFSGSICKSYPTKAMAEVAWNKHLNKEKVDFGNYEFKSSKTHNGGSGSGSSSHKGKALTSGVHTSGYGDTKVVRDPTMFPLTNAAMEFVPDRKASQFLGHYPMQMWLLQAFPRVRATEPMYTRHDYKLDNGSICYRYQVSLKCSLFRFPSVSVFGRYAYTDEEAKEDAAYKMLKLLSDASNMTIWDFNYDNMVALQGKLQKLEADNFDIILENGYLKEEIKILKNQLQHGQR